MIVHLPKSYSKFLKILVVKNAPPPLPPHTPEALPDKFCTFFHDKVVQIRETLENEYDPRSLPTSESFQGEHFVAFQPVSCETVKNIIKACPPKSCHSDPITNKFGPQSHR